MGRNHLLRYRSDGIMTEDEQEALSRKYSDDVILLLPLESGRIAVLNNARELCGCLDTWCYSGHECLWHRIKEIWHAPAKPAARPVIDLNELGLL